MQVEAITLQTCTFEDHIKEIYQGLITISSSCSYACLFLTCSESQLTLLPWKFVIDTFRTSLAVLISTL